MREVRLNDASRKILENGALRLLFFLRFASVSANEIFLKGGFPPSYVAKDRAAKTKECICKRRVLLV
jgi:hypothetical protein